MIAFLRGTACSVGNGYVDLDVAGVGYRTFIPEHWAGAMAAGEELFVYTYQVVREDAILLFGFQTEEERRWFELLIGVSGIGPKGAMQVLSAAGVRDFAEAVDGEDVSFLCGLPGIGKKTAQRLIVELKDKVSDMWNLGVSGRLAEPPVRRKGGHPLYGDIIEALVALGYNERQVADLVREILDGDPSLSIEEVLRRSLQLLAR